MPFLFVYIKANEGPCLKPKLTITTIIATFNELDGDQTKIIQGYATLARAKLFENSAEDLANVLKTRLSDPLVRVLTKAQSAFLLREQKRKLIDEACHEITYLNHGVEESFCTQLKSNIDSDMGKLISYKRKDMCLGKSNEKIVLIPVKVSNKSSTGAINMEQLLQHHNDSYWKTKGSTFLRIPNEKWLLENGWIYKGQKGPFYVKKFEIFLPPLQPKHGTEYIVQTQAKVVASTINNVSYVFPPEVNTMQFNYYENAHSPSLACLEKLTPYAQCQGTHLRPVCIIGKPKDAGPFYPPITSLWKLDIQSRFQIPEINSKTPFFLHARVQLCSSGTFVQHRPKRSIQSPTSQTSAFGSHCCQKGNEYYDPMEKIAAAGNNPCKRCPPGSSPRLEGSFCEVCPVGQQSSKELYGCEVCSSGTQKNSTRPANCQ